MSTTKESIKKILEEKRQGTKNQGMKNQGAHKKVDKTLGREAQTTRSQRSRSSTVNKSI